MVFYIRYEHFNYQIMFFSFFNVLANLQGYINKIFAGKFYIFVMIYFDNIFVYTENPGQPHVETVKWVLVQLRKYSFDTNLKKCQFYKEEIRFLGFVISAKNIKMKEERIDEVKTWPKTQSVRNIQVFLNLANFYRRFINNIGAIKASLTLMLWMADDKSLITQTNKKQKS